MFSIDEIIKLKNEGFTAEDIVELSKIKADVKEEPKEEQKEAAKEEPKEEPKEEQKADAKEESKEKLKEQKNPIGDLDSFNDKMDELLKQIKANNIKNQYIETPKEITGIDVLANVINPKTKEVIKE